MQICIFFQTVAEMAGIGFGLPKDAFTSLMKQVIDFLTNCGSAVCYNGISS